MIMGFKEDTRAELDSLARRVTTLETLAQSLRAGGVVSTTVATQNTQATRGQYDGITGASRPSSNGVRSTVDYGAIAFGLSELKREAGNLGADVPPAYFPGVVQYFADVFAKSDPNFDAELFTRQAGA
jgi:hypothetical protein